MWQVRQISDQVHAGFNQEVENGSRSVSACIIVVEQQVTVWVAFAYIHIYMPVGVDHTSVRRRYGGYMARVRQEAQHRLFSNTLRSPEFHKWATWWIVALFRDHTERCTFHF